MATMELLLKENVDHLGTRGQVVRVKAGYGRNYLLPQGLAVEATAANIKMIERERKRLLKIAADELSQAQVAAGNLTGIVLTFARKVGAHGVLYGSVTVLDIAEGLKEKGAEVERRRIQLKEPIKETGEFEVPIKLHAEVKTGIKVIVVDEEKAAEA